MDFCLSTNIVHIYEQPAEFCRHTEHLDIEISCWEILDGSLDRLLNRVDKLVVRWIGLLSGWIGFILFSIIILLTNRVS